MTVTKFVKRPKLFEYLDLEVTEALLHVQSPCRGGLDSKVRRCSIPGGRRRDHGSR